MWADHIYVQTTKELGLNRLMGSCQKNLKIREKLGLIRQEPPTLLSNFFFLKIWKHENNTKNTQKTQHFQKKIIIRVGA